MVGFVGLGALVALDGFVVLLGIVGFVGFVVLVTLVCGEVEAAAAASTLERANTAITAKMV